MVQKPAAASDPGPRAWLLLVYELPARPSNVRVKTWRRLQRLGAVGVKNSVYVLPNSPQAREDFEWLRAEIAAQKGRADVFAAEAVDAQSSDEIVELFRRARQQDYQALQRMAEKLLRRGRGKTRGRPDRQRLERTLRGLRERWEHIAAMNFFNAAGREEAAAALAAIEELLTGGEPTMRAKTVPEGTLRTEDYQGRVWVTRPGPKVDRMACAWLVRRFVDAGARFAFAPKPEDAPDAVPFDMYGVEFSHHGDACSFETLLARFAIHDAAANRVAQIVHDLDLKDEKYGAAEAGAVGRMVEGLCQMYADDQERLEQGMRMFEALYQSFLANPSGAGSTRAKTQRK